MRAFQSFAERGIRPPSRESVTVGECDLKLIHLSSGDDTGLLQYVRNGGIAFPHIMVPESLQLRSTARTSTSNNSNDLPSIMLKRPEDESGDAKWVLAQTLLWLWNAKQHASEFATHARTQALLRAESWLPPLLANYVFGRVAGTLAAARTDAEEAEEAEGQRSMLTITEGPISCVAWHPHRSLVAISHRASDVVFIYDLANDAWCSNVLQNPYMKGITCMTWQPNCGYALAVGGTAGVCLW
ncbi:hypothetical protein IWW38_006345, partial [Coemansia aciculifera]